MRAVDQHCHPLRRWPFELDSLGLRAAFSEALDPRLAREHVPAAVAYRRALRLLSQELGCEASEQAVLEVRRGRDPAEYANRLLEAGGAGLLLLDHGFAVDAFTPAEHRAFVRLPQREIVRLETLAERLVAESESPEAWTEAVREQLRREVRSGAVAVKTIAAYRASLRLREPAPEAAREAYARLRAEAASGSSMRLSGDPLCHLLLFAAAEECRDLGVPLQVHCGFGDPDEDLAEASPLGLRPLLHDSRYAGLRLVLLHCYPFHREAAYLCAVHPDAHMDLSLTIPLAGLDGERALREALGLCPWTKLLYASDASRLPELYFVAGTLHRRALAGALGQLVDEGTLTLADAVEAGREVLAGNAARLYRLG